MNIYRLVGIATLGSIAVLCSAFFFEYVLGYSACKMCIWQRWPHLLAVLIGLIILATRLKILSIFGALSALTTAGIGFYHAGVEYRLWSGPSSCTSNINTEISASDLLNQILDAPIVRCDDVVWDLFGISMAGWNGILSLGLFGVWVVTFLSKQK